MRLFLTLLLAALLGLALADGHSDDREVQSQLSGTEGQIESRGANGNEIDLEYRLGSGELARFDLEFKSETNSTETELDVRVRLIEIFEYTPSAPGAAFPDNGTKLNVYGPGTWNNIQASTANNVTTWSASTTDGAVSIDLFFTDSPRTIGSTSLDPSSFKFTLTINRPVATGNYLGATFRLSSTTTVEYEDGAGRDIEGDGDVEGDELEIRTRNTNVVAILDWVPTITYGNMSTAGTVLNTAATDNSEQETIHYSFVPMSGEELSMPVVWDPRIGIVSGASSALTLSVGLVMAALALIW